MSREFCMFCQQSSFVLCYHFLCTCILEEWIALLRQDIIIILIVWLLLTYLIYQVFLFSIWYTRYFFSPDIFASHDGREESNEAPSIQKPGRGCQHYRLPRVSHKALHQRRLPLRPCQARQTLPREQQNRYVGSGCVSSMTFQSDSCVIRFPMLYLIYFHSHVTFILIFFALSNPTPCIFRRYISLPVH